MQRFKKLPQAQRSIVFYSEGRNYWVHLAPIIKHLLEDHDRTICYLSSSADDPGLHLDDPRVLPFLIGDGAVRTTLFRTQKSGVVIMTMPDLETYHIKRSAYPAHYIFVHHSAASSHMVYRHDAFTHFDTIFCVGPHHNAETRRAEEVFGLPAKALFNHGYGRLDSIMANAPERPAGAGGKPFRILIAPSWSGDNGLGMLESLGAKVIEPFLAAGHQVTLRPHPLTRRNSPKLMAELVETFSANNRFAYDDDVTSQESLLTSDLMVSDWSGASFDYAFGMVRPVLFIDLPRKVNNPDYQRLEMEPLEVHIRSEIGAVVAPEQLPDAGAVAAELIADGAATRERILASRAKWIYNLGSSGCCGAEYVAELSATRSVPGAEATGGA